MSETSSVRTGLYYGSLSGLAVLVFYIAVHLAGFNIFGAITMLNIWIPVVFIILAIRHQRDRVFAGIISFGRAFKAGIATTFFAALLFGLGFYLFGKIFDHGILNSYKMQAELSMEEGKKVLSEGLIEKAMESIDMTTMETLAMSESFNKVLWGGVVSLLAAAVMKRNVELFEK
jgi:hypothetical protein